MAMIVEFREVVVESNRTHEGVECGYRTFNSNGKRILQLDTYGSLGRKIPGKVSQSIQLDKPAAAKLMEIIATTFPELS